MLETLLSIASAIGTGATAGSALLKLLKETKEMLSSPEAPQELAQESPQTRILWAFPRMQPFQPQLADQFKGGAQWLPALQGVAAQNGNPWVAQNTQGILGIDLTGVWIAPINPADQTYIRQFGTYVNLVTGIGGTPTGFGEGLFDPSHLFVHFVGRNSAGGPFEFRGQLLPNWVIQGVGVTAGPFMQWVQIPITMAKVA